MTTHIACAILNYSENAAKSSTNVTRHVIKRGTKATVKGAKRRVSNKPVANYARSGGKKASSNTRRSSISNRGKRSDGVAKRPKREKPKHSNDNSSVIIEENKVPEKLYHYTSANADSILEKGLTPGLSGKVFTTPAGNLSPFQAQIDLALPSNRGLPQHLIEIDIATLKGLGIRIPQPYQVARMYNMPGGGTEVVFPQSLPAKALTLIR